MLTDFTQNFKYEILRKYVLRGPAVFWLDSLTTNRANIPFSQLLWKLIDKCLMYEADIILIRI